MENEEKVDAFLAHYGKKGMKWGVRRGSLRDRAAGATIDRRRGYKEASYRVAKGTGSLKDKVRVGARMSAGELILNKGLKNSAQKRYDSLVAQEGRLKAGKETIRDKVSMYAGTSLAELPVQRKS